MSVGEKRMLTSWVVESRMQSEVAKHHFSLTALTGPKRQKEPKAKTEK